MAATQILRLFGTLFVFVSLARTQQYGFPSGDQGSILTKGKGLASSLLARPAVHDAMERVQFILDNGLADYTKKLSSFDVRPICLNHTMIMLRALVKKERWALRMIDAMGKPPTELMNFHMTWIGSYDECIAVNANVTMTRPTSPFKGQYCKAVFGLAGMPPIGLFPASLQIGFCVPSTCSADDANNLVNTLVSLIPVNTSILDPPRTSCQQDLQLSTKAIAMIAMCGFFVAVMTIATMYDIVTSHCIARITGSKIGPLTKYVTTKEEESAPHQNGDIVVTRFSKLDPHSTENGVMDHKPPMEKLSIQAGVEKPETEMEMPYKSGTLGKLLLSFSVYTNAGKILNATQSPGALTAVNGIRFLGMTWVILGHVFYFQMSVLANSATFFPHMLKRITFQAIVNATFAVDTFFCMSGLLVSYLSLKEMKKVGGAKKFKWGMYYFHRFWRLTPPYILFMMVWAITMKYWSNGPLWNQGGDGCPNWWRNMLYINNLYKPMENDCMGWAWYLANDMQFFVVSPLMLIPLYYSPIWGGISCLVFVLANFITSGVISSLGEMNANLFFAIPTNPNAFSDLYIKPWCRIGPYAVGMFTGYVLYTTNCKIRMPKIVNFIGWTLATAAALFVLYGLYSKDGGAPTLNNDLSALYNATSRTIWGACVCWVIFSCATGYGGPVNKLLSWPAVIPLSRLTYCAYLVHPVVMDVYLYSRRNLVYTSDTEIVFQFLGFTCASYITAFVLSLAFEAPMMGLEKVILKRGKSN